VHEFYIIPDAYDLNYVTLQWMDNAIERSGTNLHVADYHKVEFKQSKQIHVNGDYGQSFDTLLIEVELDRDFPVYFLRDFFPCILIVMLSWVSFWIDHKTTPGRVALGITTVLTIVTMTNSIRQSAPKAKKFRSLDYYLLICMMFVFAALAEYAVVGMTYYKTKRYWKLHQANNSISRDDIDEEEEKRKKSHFDFGAAYRQIYDFLGNKEKQSKTKEDETQELQPIEENTKMIGQITVTTDKSPMRETVNISKKVRKVRFIGPFVLFDENQHVIDNISKIGFPLMFILANGVYFLFHYYHPDTVS